LLNRCRALKPYPGFESLPHRQSATAIVLQNALVGLGYFLLAELVLLPRFVGGSAATPVWPADGLAVAAVWLLGPRVLPGIFIASAIIVGVRAPLPVALIGPLGPVAETLIAVRLLRRLRFDDRLERLRDPLVLSLVAAPIGAAAAASIGTMAAWALGVLETPDLAWGWLLWVMRNWLGIAMFVPLVFAWRSARPVRLTQPVLVEAGVLVTALLFLAAFIVWMWAVTIRDLPVGFLAFPFVVWAGLRFGARGASAVVATVVTASPSRLGLPARSHRAIPARDRPGAAVPASLMVATVGPVLAATKAERDDAVAKRTLLEEQLRHSQKMESWAASPAAWRTTSTTCSPPSSATPKSCSPAWTRATRNAPTPSRSAARPCARPSSRGRCWRSAGASRSSRR
jgi:integral membrane sensor domain MASE1